MEKQTESRQVKPAGLPGVVAACSHPKDGCDHTLPWERCPLCKETVCPVCANVFDLRSQVGVDWIPAGVDAQKPLMGGAHGTSADDLMRPEIITASDEDMKRWQAAMAGGPLVAMPDPAPRAPIYWEKQIRKVVVTLNIGDYQPAIRELTYPLMYAYVKKIGADFCEITTRKYPDWPIVMEKEQCADICRDAQADWVIYFDADALVSRECFDPTDHLNKAEVCFNGKDMSGIRSRADKYFRRDGRFIGACSWFMVASDWTADSLWRIPDDLTFEQCKQSIFTSIQEHNGGCFKDDHLIDDYVHSRNIAQYGLKHRQFMDICGGLGWRDQFGRGANPFMFHTYSVPYEVKLNAMLTKLSTPQDRAVDVGGGRDAGPGWQMMSPGDVKAFREKWGLK